MSIPEKFKFKRTCPYCHQQMEDVDMCAYRQSIGKTCDDRHCKSCYGDRAWVFDRT